MKLYERDVHFVDNITTALSNEEIIKIKIVYLNWFTTSKYALKLSFAECFLSSTRQSSFSGDPVKATLPSVLAYALGKVANFFVSLFSIFGYKYNWNISKYMDITGSYYNKYIIDK